MPLQIVVYRKVINIILQPVLSGDLTRLPHEVAVIVDRTVVIERVEVIRTVGTVVQKIAEDIVQICPLYQFVFVTESVVKRLTADAGALQNVLHGDALQLLFLAQLQKRIRQDLVDIYSHVTPDLIIEKVGVNPRKEGETENH